MEIYSITVAYGFILVVGLLFMFFVSNAGRVTATGAEHLDKAREKKETQAVRSTKIPGQVTNSPELEAQLRLIYLSTISLILLNGIILILLIL